MGENLNMMISQDLFDEMIASQIALFKQIHEKSESDEALTQEETDFVNVFRKYAEEVAVAAEKQNNKQL
ncbi:hypothetical protein [Bacillus sp. Marseille-P3800]|uniref:hypothetical protein n=1 Tax=Bacillus sp. Marseille-P3800 TaxID=2014782 RepID=UPI000C070B70|nr:hypothetical protein [Bacillus sp. Marseille-P3800]